MSEEEALRQIGDWANEHLPKPQASSPVVERDDDLSFCENCGRAVTPDVDAFYCNSCTALVCRACVEPGDDVTGDICPVCGSRFD